MFITTPRAATRRATKVLAAVCFLYFAAPVPAQSGATADVPQSKETPLRFWNRQITSFREPYERITPEQRVQNTLQRIGRLPEVGDFDVRAQEVRVGDLMLYVVTVNGEWIIRLLPGDANPLAGETLAEKADDTALRLKEAMEARAAQRDAPLVIRGAALTAGATLAALALLSILVILRRRLLRRLQRQAALPGRPINLAQTDARPALYALQRWAVKLVTLTVQCGLIFLWLTFVLLQFPYTRPWGEQLGGFLVELLADMGHGTVGAIPGLFTVAVIFLITRTVTRLLGAVFRGVEAGRIELGWIQPETARATRRLVAVVIWVFALTVAYPHIPGSETDAFKGVSVLIGLMVSLGSAGVVNQVMSGLVTTYSRAFKPGEYVRIGDTEGTVTDVGMLATKLITARREEITIPNAVLVGTTAVNYSRLSGADGSKIATGVTIGYDTPWRQVHALLLRAAGRTQHVRRDPPPTVLQRSLAQFFVEYTLLASIDRPAQRNEVLSELHAHIQDVFNESEIQMMSPQFESQPENRVVVPRSKWFVQAAGDDRTSQTTAKDDLQLRV
jgi:small-conductance mechanosensitive channel